MIMNSNDCCESKVRMFLSHNILFSGDEFPYGNDISLLEEGVIDSMGVLELVSFVQSAFGIAVEPNDVTRDNFDSISRLAAYIRAKGGQGEQ
jgi:acyl carrier protein